MDYTPQEPCTEQCPPGRHYHLETPSTENAWAIEAVGTELYGGFGMKILPGPGEPEITAAESARRVHDLLADAPPPAGRARRLTRARPQSLTPSRKEPAP